ncbi:hypothetical protein [Chryseobacterium oryctis]|uniref:GLPGLI family protein n=1 Tax=Chryseobacterium oryctis TaxID=2952618 RepID=A0ABT3HPT8_9FLAO|nr:hypothetical protein [Chryseobacterium oryctis]MCW3161795.1 hypothetical protein [Chryseobacterium oryctis]
MINRILFIIGICSTIFIKAQKNEYISLGNDQYGNSLFYKLDKTLGNEFFYWFKIEYTMNNDPGMFKSEFYVNAKCENKTTAMLKYKNDWRKDDEDDGIYEVTKEKVKYIQSVKNDKTYFLFKKNCK